MADARYASWIRQQPCALCLGPGPCHAHHHTEGLTYDPEMERPRKALGGKRGKSQKADDVFLMPLHLRCHKHVHEFTGPCSDWSQEQRRAWQDGQVKQHRERFAVTMPERIEPPTATSSRTTRGRIGAGWTVATVRDWLRREAPTRPAHVAAALDELAGLLERDCFE